MFAKSLYSLKYYFVNKKYWKKSDYVFLCIYNSRKGNFSKLKIAGKQGFFTFFNCLDLD